MSYTPESIGGGRRPAPWLLLAGSLVAFLVAWVVVGVLMVLGATEALG